ncbi:HAD family hydrolase [Streptomyces tsukubensis]|uniref:HAD family hydrolase n=1 Tax=Streptomyces tsukubensis TaxID=83656 RepID=UPI003685B35A
MVSLTGVLSAARHVLLDFDGPVASVFAGYPAPEVAQHLHDFLSKEGGSLPADWAAESDPLALLRAVADQRPAHTVAADAYLGQLEGEAVKVAAPTPGGESLLQACRETRRTVWIVSNNATAAIAAYLAAHDLEGQVAGVFGRVPGDPASMKPNPRLLLDALAAAGAAPSGAVFIGDAVRDVEAGAAAGVATIGYANKPHKDQKLRAAGAVAVTDSMLAIAQAVTEAGPLRD